MRYPGLHFIINKLVPRDKAHREPMTIQEKLGRKAILALKRATSMFRLGSVDTVPVFIMGYGRSGTTMLFNAFARDLNVETLHENDARIAENFILQEDRLDTVVRESNARVIVMKPILNSFDARRLLDRMPHARTVWMIRDYRDVISSALKKFGNSVAMSLKAIVSEGGGDNWLAKGMPDRTLQDLRDLDSSGFGDSDWMALVWWSVNRTLIIDELTTTDRVLTVHYESLVENPNSELARVYAFVGLPYNKRLSAHINTSSVGKGKEIVMSSEVTEMCESLSAQLRTDHAEAGGS